MPHLHAAQRRTSCVVPVNAPSTRAPIRVFARGSSLDGKKAAPRRPPVVWLAPALTRLLSGNGWARTQAAHCAWPGSAEPGGSVPKWAGAPATLAAAGAVPGRGVAAGVAEGVAVGVAVGPGVGVAGGGCDGEALDGAPVRS